MRPLSLSHARADADGIPNAKLTRTFSTASLSTSSVAGRKASRAAPSASKGKWEGGSGKPNALRRVSVLALTSSTYSGMV
jgi:hypothetical protein